MYVDKMIGNAEEIKPLVLLCLDENPKMRPVIGNIFKKVKELKCHCQGQERGNKQQGQLVLQTHRITLPLESDLGKLFPSEPVNQEHLEKSSLNWSALIPRVSYAICKSDGCLSEMAQGCDGYCLRCFFEYTEVRYYLQLGYHACI